MEKYKNDVAYVQKQLAKELSDLKRDISKAGSDTFASIYEKISLITIRDDNSDAVQKLGIHDGSARLESFIRHTFDSRIIRNVEYHSENISPYQLPAFDADGNRSGNMASVRPEPVLMKLKIGIPSFSFHLKEWEWIIDVVDTVWGGLAGIFSEAAEKASVDRKERRLAERKNHVKQEFSSGWNNHIATVVKNSEEEVARQYQAIFDAIDGVYVRIQRQAGGSVSDAKKNIDNALLEVSVRPVFTSQLLNALNLKIPKEKCRARL